MEREKATFTKFAISLHLIWRVQWFKSVLQKYKKILNGITNGISCMSCLDNTNKNISLPSSTAFLMEIIHSVVGTYLFNFQPLLTRTEVHVILLLWFLSFIPFWFSLFFLLLFLPFQSQTHKQHPWQFPRDSKTCRHFIASYFYRCTRLVWHTILA